MRDTIDKHGSIRTPCGLWISQSKRVLVFDSWFVDPEGDMDVLKRPVAEWLFDNGHDFHYNGYAHHGATITFGDDAGAMLFRMFWDDRVPK